MQTYLMELLNCPACRGSLLWTIDRQSGERIEEGEARCADCGAAYPLRDGIGCFLTPDLQRNDLWEQVDSELATYLRDHPEVEAALLDSPLESLAPADRFFRSMIEEERGRYAEARAARESADRDLYTQGVRSCSSSQVDSIVSALSGPGGPVVDIASGQGHLVEALLRRTERDVVATDFSPRVLRRARSWFEFFGLYERLSLLAFDARRTPFKDRSVQNLTTYLGLANIENPGALLSELRRATRGTFMACTHFYPEDDPENGAVIRRFGLDGILYRRPLLESFAGAGWSARVANSCESTAAPTPESALVEGARIDGLPVAETCLEWGTVVAE